MNHQGLRWNVHYVANVALRIRLNLYKRGFKIYDLLVFFFFVVLSATRRRPPLGRTKDRRESRNLLCFSPKAVETLIYADNVMDMYIVFVFVLFIFIHVRFEGNKKYAKKVLSQPWNSLTLQISLSLREKHDKIVFTLQGYFGRSDNLLRSPRIFVILDKRSELSGCFLFKRLQRSDGILIIFELIPSKELVFRVERPRSPLGRTKDSRESRDLRCLFAKSF